MKKPQKERLERIVKQFVGKKVLIIGDVMLDEYVFGTTSRLSPEAPIPIVDVEKTVHVPGGAANAAFNLRSIGDETFLVGVVGKDEQAQQVKALLEEKGVKTDGLFVDPSRPTTLKSRIISQNQHIVRIDREKKHPLSKEMEKKLLRFVLPQIAKSDIVLISDYDKGVVTSGLAQTVIATAKKKGKKVLVDPKGVDFSKYRGCFMVTPNLKELEIALRMEKLDIKTLPQSAKMLLVHVNADAVLVTLSKHGMALLEKNGRYIHLPAPNVRVVDISGAGDTAIATFALALAAGADFEEAMFISTFACAVVIGKPGTATCSREELYRSIRETALE